MDFKTQNDLCADVVTLDYQTMLSVAKSAYAYAMDRVYDDYSSIRNKVLDCKGDMDDAGVWVNIQAENLVKDSLRVQAAANMAHALEAGLGRSEVKIVNKPEVKGG